MSILVTMLKKWSKKFEYKPDIDAIVSYVLEEFERCVENGLNYTKNGIHGYVECKEFIKLSADERNVVILKVRRALFKTRKYRYVSASENMYDCRLIMLDLLYKRGNYEFWGCLRFNQIRRNVT